MPFDAELAGRLRDALAAVREITELRMFGGLAFLLNGNMLVGVSGDRLIARIGEQAAAAALVDPSVLPFGPAGRPLRGWVVVRAEAIGEPAQLEHWVRQAIALVSQLPPKPARQARAAAVSQPLVRRAARIRAGRRA